MSQKLRLCLSIFLCAVFASAQSNITSQSATATCSELRAQLGVDTVQTSGPEFLDVIAGTWDLFNTVQQPACIVLPRNASHVQTAMRAIFKAEVPYAVRAGAHSANKGWNIVDGGILISFTHMANVSFNPQTDTITIQPGIRWGDALADLEQSGVAPLGGRVGDVGTGLLPGGGLSYLAAQYGFSADAYKELDVVLVNGDLVTATATNEFSDLFRALKGGANRFGIVTRYEVSAIHTGTNDDKNFFGGLIFFPNDAAEAILQATANYVQNTIDPNAALLSVIRAPDNTTDIVHLAVLIYRGSELPADIFGEFLSIPSSLSSLGPMSYLEASNVTPGGVTRGSGQNFLATAFNGGPDQYLNALQSWNNFTTTFENQINFTGSAITITPILDSQIAAGIANGGNAIDPPRGSYAALLYTVESPLGQLIVSDEVEAGRQLLLQQTPPSPGIPLYVNECDASQDVFSTYGGFEFLKSTYAKYDPTRFNVRFTQGPIGL